MVKKMQAGVEAKLYYAELCYSSADDALMKAKTNLRNLRVEREMAEKEYWDYEEDCFGRTVRCISEDDKLLNELCNRPLIDSSDGNKLKELEERFPGGTFVLTTDHEQHEVSSVDKWKGIYTGIFSKNAMTTYLYFKTFGQYEKPQLMVEWHGLYIDLSHLF